MNAMFVVRFVDWMGNAHHREFKVARLAKNFARRMAECGHSNVTVTLEDEFHSMRVSWQ